MTITETTGVEADFEEFVRTRSDALFGTALMLTGDRHLAEDLLQTALAQAWRSWGRVHTSHEGVVRRTLVNTYLSWWRRRWNGERPTEVLPEQPGPAADHEGRLDLHAAVQRLPRRQRAVVVLRYFDDLPEAEVAAILGCSVGTVKSQAHRALAKLRDEVDLVDGANPERYEQVGDRVHRATRARRTAGAVALVVALVVGIGVAGALSGALGGGDGIEPAPAPTPAPTSLESVLAQPGWETTDYGATGGGADIGLQRGEDYLVLRWWPDVDHDAMVDELRSEGSSSLSRTLDQEIRLAQVGDEYQFLLPPAENGTFLLVRAGMRRVELEEVLAALRTDDLQAWSIAAEGPTALTAQDPRTVTELVAAGPVPDDFDLDMIDPLTDLGRVEALQAAAEQVSCAWASAVADSLLGGDSATTDEAIATTRDWASWPVFRALGGLTTYPDTAGRVLSGTPNSLSGDWSARLGCEAA